MSKGKGNDEYNVNRNDNCNGKCIDDDKVKEDEQMEVDGEAGEVTYRLQNQMIKAEATNLYW